MKKIPIEIEKIKEVNCSIGEEKFETLHPYKVYEDVDPDDLHQIMQGGNIIRTEIHDCGTAKKPNFFRTSIYFIHRSGKVLRLMIDLKNYITAHDGTYYRLVECYDKAQTPYAIQCQRVTSEDYKKLMQ